MGSIAVLPNELVETVFRFVDIKTLLRCRETCRYFCTTIDSSSDLTYRVELEKVGLVDDPTVKMVAATKLTLLEDWTDAWDAMRPSAAFEISLKESCSAYELVGGVFAKAMPNPAVSGSNFSRTLLFIRLPTVREPAIHWNHKDVGFDMRDFAIDPSIDLLVLLPHELSISQEQYLRLHIRTMTTNQPHPLATQPILQHPFVGSLMGAEIQVADDMVSVQSSHRLLIWNWRTGCLVVDLRFNSLPVDFNFISPRAFVIVNVRNHSLDIYSIDPEAAMATKSTDICIGRTTKLRSRLKLPKPYDGACRLSIHTSPYMPNRPRVNFAKETKVSYPEKVNRIFATPKPFQTRADNRIHVLTLEALGGDMHENVLEEPEAYFVAIKNSAFEEYATWDVPEDGAKTLMFNEWSYQSHWTPTDRLYPWLRYTHGSRYVLPAGILGPDGSVGPQLRIIDYGARGPFSPGSPGPGKAKRTPSTKNLRPRVAPSPLQLPEAQYSGFMVDEDRILGFMTDDRHRLSAIIVLCFV